MFEEIKQLLIEVYNLSLGSFFSLEKRIHWFYLLTSTLLAFYVFKRRQKQDENFGSYLFKKENFLSKSAIVDYSFLVFNALIKIYIIASFSYWSKYYQFEYTEWLMEHFGLASKGNSIPLLTIGYILALLILGDFSYYLLHLIYHKVPFLWAFHKVHHSSTALNPITQYRIHPVELIINNLRYIVVLTFLNGTFDYLTAGAFQPKTFLGVNIILLSFNSWGANLRHSHIKLTYFNWLENWLISPFQHQIHHSAQKELYNKNLGSKLAIWDKLFGTLVRSKEVDNLEVGLGEKDKEYKSFIQNIINPFRSLFNSKY